MQNNLRSSLSHFTTAWFIYFILAQTPHPSNPQLHPRDLSTQRVATSPRPPGGRAAHTALLSSSFREASALTSALPSELPERWPPLERRATCCLKGTSLRPLPLQGRRPLDKKRTEPPDTLTQAAGPVPGSGPQTWRRISITQGPAHPRPIHISMTGRSQSS